MHFKQYVTSLLIFLSLSSAMYAQASVYREFKNDAGQTVKARPLSVFGSKVRIELENGTKMNVDVGIFNQEGSDYLTDWAIVDLANSGKLLELNVTKREEKVKDYTQDINLTNGGVSKDALEIKEYEGYYDVILQNKSQFPIDGLRVEYRTFSEEDKQAAQHRDDQILKRESGSLLFTLPSGEEVRKKTTVINMIETRLGKGIRYSSGGDIASKAKMIGIWTKLYYKDTLVMEYALPSNLPRTQKWGDELQKTQSGVDPFN